VIEWNPDPAGFIAKAISPARVSGVYLNEQKGTGGKTATVVVPEDQLSLAIGRDGQNARLAAKLTSWRIDIKSLPEAASDSLYKLQNDPTLVALVEPEKENAAKMEELLARKAEGRPLTPEEYDFMTKFVDRVERRATVKTAEQKKEEEDRMAELRRGIPAAAFTTTILDSGLPEHVAYLLQEAGYATVSDLAIQMKADSDNILRLQGIGPRAMESINALMISLEAQAAAASATETESVEAPSVVEEIPAPVEEVQAAPVEEITEPVFEEAAPVEVETPAAGPEKVSEEPEEEPSLEELFTLRPEVLETVAAEDEEGSDEFGDKKKKGKKKTKSVEVTYDPDRDTTTVRKKHKRGGGWDWEE
jgi:N utilization substance protein A